MQGTAWGFTPCCREELRQGNHLPSGANLPACYLLAAVDGFPKAVLEMHLPLGEPAVRAPGKGWPAQLQHRQLQAQLLGEVGDLGAAQRCDAITSLPLPWPRGSTDTWRSVRHGVVKHQAMQLTTRKTCQAAELILCDGSMGLWESLKHWG